MTDRLAGRVCLVTGSTGIAAAAAVSLAEQGASIFAASRTGAHADALAARIRSAGGRAAARAADLSREVDADAAVGACVEAYGRIDGLFSVAGGSGRRFGDGPIHELTAEGWDRTLELNLRSQAMVCRAVARQMLAQEPNASGTRGSIVLVSSVLATHPVPELFATHAYAAAKGAIVALGLAMAATYAPSGIRVNVLAPGLTDTPMAARAAADPGTVAFVLRKQPLAGGFLKPADIAAAAVYLLADESRAVTGQVLSVDGGWSVVSVSAVSPDAPVG
jgi:NAD(P)-dependent dehydrogenase (short-subunit alcohol dehydrogenase family)